MRGNLLLLKFHYPSSHMVFIPLLSYPECKLIVFWVQRPGCVFTGPTFDNDDDNDDDDDEGYYSSSIYYAMYVFPFYLSSNAVE